MIMCTCKLFMYTCILNHVYLQDKYVYKYTYVCMQDNHVYMQDIYVCMYI